MKSEVSANVNIKGENTGNTYTGIFTAKTKLSYREMISQDALRRQILGPDPKNAAEAIWEHASLASYLQVRLIDAPDWWKQSNGGLDGPVGTDHNVLTTVFNTVAAKIEEEIKAHAKEAEDAQKQLGEDAKKD